MTQKCYLRYTDCWVDKLSINKDSYATTQTTPFQCRIRNCTYSVPIYVNVCYTCGRQIVVVGEEREGVTGYVSALSTSSMRERKSKAYIFIKHERIF